MKKIALVSSISLVLVACSDDAEKQRQLQAQQYAQQQQFAQQQYAQQQYAQQQYAQPPVMQPQVIQAPAAPVVVQQQHDNTLTNMALGAVIGHTIANMGSNDNRSSERVVEHKTVIIDNRTPNVTQPLTPNVPAQVSQPVAPAQPKTSAMDMNKLSGSANQTFNTSAASHTKQSGMDMSRLSSSSTSRPTVSLSKPSSSMNMSKLGRK